MSGESIVDVAGESVISKERLDEFCEQIAAALVVDPFLQIAVVVGGGNILRGKDLAGFDRTKADHMGMLATVINGLALQDALTRAEIESRVQTGIEVPKVAEPYNYNRAIRHLEKGRVVVFAGGTGNPYFTTDTAAALRAAEVHADELLLGKYGTDGVYDKDPNLNADAIKYPTLDYDVLITKNLQVMDVTAATLCKDNGVPILVFDMDADGAVRDALLGRGSGTRVSSLDVAGT